MKLSTMMIPLSLSFMMMKHPLSMSITILMITLMIVIMTGFMNTTFWFSYILFLILIGGMLILFIYMTSIAANEKFKFSNKILILNLMMIVMISLLNTENQLFTKTQETKMFINQLQNSTNIKYFTPSLSIMLISIMIYLLIVLIMIVKITKKNKGPIRQK